mmetsp:Transcript_21943/g.30844  ORF Transcript_21943/g.30844 Transcript_21943/m.30844 type:complete len:106 (-) Transcript_21943:5-322(-)
MEKHSKMVMSKGRMMLSKPVFEITNRKIPTDFIVSLPSHNSWWYCIPSFHLSGKRPARYTTDKYLPQIRYILGIGEEAVAIVLFEKGVISNQRWSRILHHLERMG